ncbi:MAG: hypothetical protein Q7V63_10180 [Gammaproteobacteria bacterium]|nr:hypothetical protein [Gammaproteobacteria bacterium]
MDFYKKIFGLAKPARDPKEHKNPNATEDGGSQNTSLAVTAALATLKGANQQKAYAATKDAGVVNAMMNTQTVANIAANSAVASPNPMSMVPSPGGSNFGSTDDPK